MKKQSLAVLFTIVAVSLAAAGGASGASLVLPRAGQVGIGLHGSFGTLLETGQLGDEFGSGFGLGVNIRYRMRYERAIGLSFDQFNLDSRVLGYPEGAFSGYRDPASDSTLTRDRLVMTTTGIDVYQMFDTRQRDVKWLSLSVGLVQVSAKLSDGETQYPIGSDGAFLGAGAGVERFFFRSWAFDVNARYQAIFYGSTVNHNLQASAGLIFYAAY
jgi:hypothetical protein